MTILSFSVAEMEEDDRYYCDICGKKAKRFSCVSGLFPSMMRWGKGDLLCAGCFRKNKDSFTGYKCDGRMLWSHGNRRKKDDEPDGKEFTVKYRPSTCSAEETPQEREARHDMRPMCGNTHRRCKFS